MKVKVRFHLPSGYSFVIEMDENDKIGRYFRVYELANMSADEEIKLEIWPESILFIEIMDLVRDDVGPIKVTSAYRTKTFNARPDVNGDPNSAHLWLCAIDTPGFYTRYYKSFKKHCADRNVKAAINKYKDRTHMEILSDKWYGQKSAFVIRNKL